MKRSPSLSALLLLWLSQHACAQITVHQQALQALRLYEIIIVVVDDACNRVPASERNARLDLICKKNRLVPPTIIERAALPYFQQVISAKEAEEVIRIYSAEPMYSITKKLVQFQRDKDPSKFSQEEQATLSLMSNTELGRKLSVFATDQQKSVAAMRAILEYDLGP